MTYIDPHIHMLARTTADYEAMAAARIVAIIEPAFWIGQPRTSVGSYIDYLSTLVGWERFRAAQFGIRHYCSIGLNSKEANNERLAEEVMEILPRFLLKEGVVAVGEIGYDEQTPAEDKYFRAQLELAKELNMLVQIHTPHRDKKRGTSRSMLNMALHPTAWSLTTTTRRRHRRCSIAASGPASPSIRAQKWATSGWSRSFGATAPNTSSLIPAPIGACLTRLRCPRRRSSCASAELPKSMCDA